ncbi:hypothetical protein [Sabulibacter ruber]|uniref:hypothetical protein n=1 Tax=Sabulibacter ruber TaxID=2811901 RepID=UPI001A95BACD|nr:hypothetical protein [Sabulibacter ruber]
MFKIQLKQFLLLTLLSFTLFSCFEENEIPDGVPLEPKLEGMYVYGSNTIASAATDPTARMNRAVLDPGKGAKVNNMPGIYGQFMYVGANSTLQFTEAKEGVSTVYGAVGGGTRGVGTSAGHTGFTDEFIYGTLEANAPAIQVTDEGLYYVFVNSNDKTFRMVRVQGNIIGDATPGQWATSTALPMVYTSKDSTVFEAKNIPLKGAAGYRYRIGNGWEVFNDNNIVTFTNFGVPNYGVAWDTRINNIGYYTDNIPNHDNGMFTVRLKYTAATGAWKETKIRTGDLLINYANTQVGFFGNAYYLPSGAEGAWNEPYEVKLPTLNGNTYTWTWEDVRLIEGREFVILENGTWGGLMFFYNNNLARTGEAFTSGKISNPGTNENFLVATGGTYDITLSINGVTDAKTLNIVSN